MNKQIEMGELDTDTTALNDQIMQSQDRLLLLHDRLDPQLQTVRKKLKSAKAKRQRRKNDTGLAAIDNEISKFTEDLTSINANFNHVKKNIEKNIATMKDKAKKVKKLTSEIKDMQWKRRNKGCTLWTKVEDLLQLNGVVTQAYHGGSLTGGAIITLLHRQAKIMDEIEAACIQAFHKRENDSLPIQPLPLETIQYKIKLHRNLFQAQDAVYSHLRIIKPTPEEKKETKNRIRIMEKFWTEMGLSETPKAHLIFRHAADDQEMFDGLGDKVEDPIEKRHQEQMRVDRILAKMPGGFDARMKTQQKYEWRNNDPRVLKQIELVRANSKRNILCTPNAGLTAGEERQERVKKERENLRSLFIQGICDDE
jgi:hypothetical protein